MKKSILYFSIIFLLIGFTFHSSIAQEKKGLFRSQMIDSLDNAFDISVWLSHVYGFMPVATLVTEPAIGYGIAGGLIHLSKKKGLDYKGKPIPPDLSMIGGMYTENGSWAAMLIYRGYWRQDRIRFRGVFGYISPNLAIYRTGILGNERKFGFNIRGPLILPSLSFRIKESNSFIGGQYIYMKNTVSFDLPFENIPINLEDTTTTISGLGALYIYDSRDNTFTPNDGLYSNVSFVVYPEALGSSQDYSRLDSYLVGFKTLSEKVVIGGRVDYRAAYGNPFFYSLPYVLLRGVPAFRYQGDQVIALESEERFDITNRWSLTAFAGLGKGFDTLDNFNTEEWAYSVGGGFRYYIARKFNIFTGIDIARGPEDWAFYIQFGHYWNNL
jgi:hypothetical protein